MKLTKSEEILLLDNMKQAADTLFELRLGIGAVTEAMTPPALRPAAIETIHQKEKALALIVRCIVLYRLVKIFWPEKFNFVAANYPARAIYQAGLNHTIEGQGLGQWIDLDRKLWWVNPPSLVVAFLKETDQSSPGIIERVGLGRLML